MQCDGHRFEHRCFGERQILGQAVANVLGHHDKLRKSSGAAIVSAGHAEYLAVVAEIDFSLQAIFASPARNRGIESYAIAGRKLFDSCSERGYGSRRFMAHPNRRNAAPRRSIVAMHVAAANPAGRYTDEDFSLTGNGCRKFRDLQMTITRKQ